MENYSFLLYVFCIIIIIVVAKVFVMPAKRIGKLLINSILGIALINAINYFGIKYGFHLGINWWTIVISGLLGIPGVILIIFLRVFI